MDDVVSPRIFGFVFHSLTCISDSTFNRYLYLFSAYIKAENPFSQQYVVENPVNGILANLVSIFVSVMYSTWRVTSTVNVSQCYVGIGIRKQTLETPAQERVRDNTDEYTVYAIVVFRYVEHRPAPKTAFSRIRRAAQTVDPSMSGERSRFYTRRTFRYGAI